MLPFPSRFNDSLEDFNRFAAKLKAGMENLQTLHEPVVGQAERRVSSRGRRVCRRSCTKKEQVYQDGKRKLHRYQQRAETVSNVPILIVYAMVNRYTILDLQPNRSLIRNLLDHGQDVYLVDWGYADRMDR